MQTMCTSRILLGIFFASLSIVVFIGLSNVFKVTDRNSTNEKSHKRWEAHETGGRRICTDESSMLYVQVHQQSHARIELDSITEVGRNESIEFKILDENMDFYIFHRPIFSVSGFSERSSKRYRKKSLLAYYLILKGGSWHIMSLLYKYAAIMNYIYCPCHEVPLDVNMILAENTKVYCDNKCHELISDSSRFAFTFVRNPLSRFISGYSEIEDHDLKQGTSFMLLKSPHGSSDRFREFVRAVVAANGSSALFDEPNGYLRHIAPQIAAIMHGLRDEGSPLHLYRLGVKFPDEWRKLAIESGFPKLEILADLPQLFPHDSSDDSVGAKKSAYSFLAPALHAVPLTPGTTAADDLCSLVVRQEDEAKYYVGKCTQQDRHATGRVSFSHEQRYAHLYGTASYHYLRALCRVYLVDWVCTGYDLPAVCADLSEELSGLVNEYTHDNLH